MINTRNNRTLKYLLMPLLGLSFFVTSTFAVNYNIPACFGCGLTGDKLK